MVGCSLHNIKKEGSFANDMCTTFTTHPNFVEFSRIDVNSIAWSEGLLLRVFVLRIGNSQLSIEDQVCSQATMPVWRVMCVPIIGPLALTATSMSLQSPHTAHQTK